MNILIIGGAGFIGLPLTMRMIADGHEVTVLDNLSPQVHGPKGTFPSALLESANCVHADICDTASLRAAMPTAEIIVHLAAETGTAQSMYEVQRYARTNVQGTAALFETMVNHRPKHLQKIVVASSRAIYGEGKYQCNSHGVVYPTARTIEAMTAGRFEPTCPRCGLDVAVLPTSEDSQLAPSSFYGLTKQIQEQMVLMFAGSLGIDAFALRYQNVYGPGQSLRNSYTGLLGVFLTLVRHGKALSVFEDGLESRDFIFIDDVIEATAKCLSPDVHGIQALNVGSGTRITVSDVAHAVRDFFYSEVPIRTTKTFRVGDIRHNLADITRISALTGFRPTWGFAEGLREFLSWATQQESSEGGFEQSMTELRERGLLLEVQ
jgi:dTDP-L-rhamnose 4-epimerase